MLRFAAVTLVLLAAPAAAQIPAPATGQTNVPQSQLPAPDVNQPTTPAARATGPAAAPVAAGPDSPMAGAFGNTIVSTAPGGVVTRAYVDPDGTYRSVTGGAESRGTWTTRKGIICYAQTVPAPAPPLCTLGANKKVGSKWSIMLPDDTSVKVALVAGR